MQELKSDIAPGNVIPNIAQMLERNALHFSDRIVYAEKHDGTYEGINWNDFYKKIKTIHSNLKRMGFEKGDKILIYSPNRLEMLLLEMAVMAGGGVSVPVFAFFHKEIVNQLVEHSDARFIALAGELQLSRLNVHDAIKSIFVFDDITDSIHKNLVPFSNLLKNCGDKMLPLETNAFPDEVCLNMYTSGTMGIPKCVQLTHRNILSQQEALAHVWKLDENDCLLAYLPWHHSFGGIFERFSALYNGASLMLESSYGKDPVEIMENWKLVKPSAFFSVPKVYQALIELTRVNKEAEDLFFHSKLKFIFTAAASLPENLSAEFEKRGIPVMEGWGLTETSPCCTITDPTLKRESGVVGKPIPGVTIRISHDGEIQVKGPNVMKGYYKNDEANKSAFTADGWYCTGDVGKITPAGLKLISRKDRIFKLTNGEKVIPSEMELLIQSKCHYITFAMIVGGGKEYPVALLFPNKKALDHPNYEVSPDEGCFCPRNINELGKCLQGCLREANCELTQKFSKIKYAMVIDDELSLEKSTLTPSMKFAPNKIMEAYRAHIENMYGADNSVNEEVFVIKLDPENTYVRERKIV